MSWSNVRTAVRGPQCAIVAVVGALLFWGGYYLAKRGSAADSSHADLAGQTGFRDLAQESGIQFRMNFLPHEQGEHFRINLYDHGCGLAIGDVDGDGYDDVYFVNQLGSNALYRNRGDGTFEDITTQAGVALGDRICTAAIFADYDNDGHQDLFVTSTRGGNVLFKNLGNGRFKDVSRESGLAHTGHSQAAVFFDYDNDGYLDLLITNTADWTTSYDETLHYHPGKTLGGGFGGDLLASRKETNILYHNNRDGTFTDVTHKAGLRGRGWGSDIAVFDYDGDGYLDVFIGSMFGPSQLFRNNGNGTFTDVTKQTLGRTSGGTTGVKVFDFNNDGKLDLYLVDMHSDMWMGLDDTHSSLALAERGQHVKYPSLSGPYANKSPNALEMDRLAAAQLGFQLEEVLFGNTFFKNLGNGRFEEVSDRANLETFWPWGIAVGDFDNDGYEDVFVPSGMGYPFYYWPNQLLMNNGDETFSERGHELGVEPPVRGIYLDEPINGTPACRSSRSAAVADFRGNGRLDIVTNNFNDRPYYFRNYLKQRNFVEFRLQGTKSNRDAIGAVVHLFSGKEVMTRQVNPAGGYLAQSSKTLHFGLGERTQIDRVEIRWPSGRRQRIDRPATNQRHDLVEPAD